MIIDDYVMIMDFNHFNHFVYSEPEILIQSATSYGFIDVDEWRQPEVIPIDSDSLDERRDRRNGHDR